MKRILRIGLAQVNYWRITRIFAAAGRFSDFVLGFSGLHV
jgi:hypothetical protein